MSREVQDPYAPPPRHKDKSGALVRFVIIAALLGVGAWGAMEYSNVADQSASLTPPAEEQMADAGNTVAPEAIPQAAPVAPSPALSTAPAPTPRAASPAPAEPVPAPTTTVGDAPAG